MRRHGPHSESHWATTCSAMLQNTRHRVSCVTGIQPTAGAVTFIFAQSRYSDYTTGWSIRHSIPGQGQIFSSPNPPYHHWDITSFFFNRYWWHFPLWQSGRCVKGNTHHLVPSVRTSRAIQPSPPPVWLLGAVLGVRLGIETKDWLDFLDISKLCYHSALKQNKSNPQFRASLLHFELLY